MLISPLPKCTLVHIDSFQRNFLLMNYRIESINNFFRVGRFFFTKIDLVIINLDSKRWFEFSIFRFLRSYSKILLFSYLLCFQKTISGIVLIMILYYFHSKNKWSAIKFADKLLEPGRHEFIFNATTSWHRPVAESVFIFAMRRCTI